MDPDLIERLSQLGFRRVDIPDTMEAEINGIGITAVIHPWKGLALFASSGTRRSIGLAEVYVPTDVPIDVLRAVVDRITARLRKS